MGDDDVSSEELREISRTLNAMIAGWRERLDAVLAEARRLRSSVEGVLRSAHAADQTAPSIERRKKPRSD
jgi:hypothetical protein